MTNTQQHADAHYWNPFAQMADTFGNQRVWSRAEGSVIYNDADEAYLDGIAGIWYMNVGYGRDEIVDAVTAQMRKLPVFSTFWRNVNEPSVELATRLAGITPRGINHFFFGSGGSEAVETALKMVRQYFRITGQVGRYKIIGRMQAYHGSTMGALSVSGITANRQAFEPLVPGAVHVPHSSIDALAERIRFEGPETVAAFIAEPVMGGGGLIVPPPDYLRQARELCDEHGILFIADEVLCGFGRAGHWFGVDHWDVVPDLMTMAKGLTSGYLPLGAVGVSDTVFEAFSAGRRDDEAFMHGNTYSGHPTACVAALANIDIIEREGLARRAAEAGARMFAQLTERLAGNPKVQEVRGGVGLMAGVDLHGSASAEPALKVAEEAFARRVIVRPLQGTTVGIAPPLVITDDQINQVVDTIAESVDAASW